MFSGKKLLLEHPFILPDVARLYAFTANHTERKIGTEFK